jgi:uncharacterized protein (TIGR02453 family)
MRASQFRLLHVERRSLFHFTASHHRCEGDAMTGFSGFPKAALEFYAGLRRDNSKAYWEAHKAVWESQVRAPMLALLAELETDYGPFHLFRPYRDTRFSKDKSPYKTQIAAYGESEGGAAHYFHLSADGLTVLSGYYRMEPDQIARYREAVADDETGAELPELIAVVTRAGLTVDHGGHEPLKRVPRPYPADHPRGDLLKWKGLVSGRELGAAAWLHTSRAKERIVATWQAAVPLNAWLDRHVGPSRELPPELRSRLGL